MKELQSSKFILLKGFLFLLLGLLSSSLLIVRHFEIKQVLLLAVAIWSFCRFYYFAFYVVERWLHPSYRFTGLFSVARFLWTRVPLKGRGETQRDAAPTQKS